MMIVKGRLQQKLKVESGTSKAGKEWQKQSIIVDNGDQYNPLVAISFFGEDKINMLEGYTEGQEVEVHINLSSREFDGKWYSQVDGWKIEKVGNEATSAPAINNSPEEYDLPF